jgi:hypothetical protein
MEQELKQLYKELYCIVLEKAHQEYEVDENALLTLDVLRAEIGLPFFNSKNLFCPAFLETKMQEKAG